jgi:glycosyltransferase involved in cell wall biosynthesis
MALLDQQHPGEPDQRGVVGEDADDVGVSADLAVEARAIEFGGSGSMTRSLACRSYAYRGLELSVIIAAHNEADGVRAQLEAVLVQECAVPFELLLVDNGSTDGTAAVVGELAERDPRLRLVGASARAGMTYARNVGVKASLGRFLVFTDADDLAAPGWLAALHTALQPTGFAAARLEHERLNPPWTVALRGREQTDGLIERRYGPPWPYAYGTTIAIRRDLHDQVGGWDETLGPSCDMDYCFRVQRDTGARLVFAPDAVMHYRHRSGLRATFRQAISYAADELVVQERHRGEWREPLTGLSWPHLILRNGRRLLKPDVHGGRLAPVANRGELGAWLWGLGLDIGRKRAPGKA